MKISFMSFSCPEATLEEMLKIANEYGYDGLEPRVSNKHKHGIDFESTKAFREQCRALSEKAGIPFACVATSCRFADPENRDEMMDDAHKGIDLAADIGAPVIRVFGGSIPEGIEREESIRQVAQCLTQLSDHAGERGVTVCMETHDAWCDPEHVAQVLKLVDHPAIAANWDIMHPVRVCNVSIDDSYKALKPWIRHVHFHDGANNEKGQIELRPIGEGIVDHARAVKLLQEHGYEGFLSGEWISWEPYEEHLPRELATMRGYEG